MPGMKSKTIKSVIARKVDLWIATIEDTTLREQVKKNVIVTGGCIVSMLLGEEVNDYDIYLRSYDVAVGLAKYYVSRFKPRKHKGIKVPLSVDETMDIRSERRVRIIAKSAGLVGEEGTDKSYEYFESRPEGEAGEYIESVLTNKGEIEDTFQETEKAALETTTDPKKKQEYRPVFLTSNAITLSDKVQIVIRFQGDPETIHKNYDFVHCTSYWTSWDNKLVLRQEALESILSRELRYVGSLYPICSVIRLRKFIARGWRVNAGQILKMCMQISKLNLHDVAVLEDQLTGVDTAYFAQMLERLNAKDSKSVDTAYLVELVDQLF